MEYWEKVRGKKTQLCNTTNIAVSTFIGERQRCTSSASLFLRYVFFLVLTTLCLFVHEFVHSRSERFNPKYFFLWQVERYTYTPQCIGRSGYWVELQAMFPVNAPVCVLINKHISLIHAGLLPLPLTKALTLWNYLTSKNSLLILRYDKFKCRWQILGNINKVIIFLFQNRVHKVCTMV